MAIGGYMPQDIVICANAGLPLDGDRVVKELEVLGNHAGHEPVTMLGQPLGAGCDEQGAGCTIAGRDAQSDQRAGTRDDGR